MGRPRPRSGRRVRVASNSPMSGERMDMRAAPANEQVASTGAKQSSRGRGTTEYENGLAPRGAGGKSIRLRPCYQRSLLLLTHRDRGLSGNPEMAESRGIFFSSSCRRRSPARGSPASIRTVPLLEMRVSLRPKHILHFRRSSRSRGSEALAVTTARPVEEGTLDAIRGVTTCQFS
jgi:hypothetical protein